MHPPKHTFILPFLILLGTLVAAFAQAPKITSVLSLEGSRGALLNYTIRASGVGLSFDAATESPSLEIEDLDPETGQMSIRILADATEPVAVIVLYAYDEEGETGEAELKVRIKNASEPTAGSPRVLVATIKVERPRLIKGDDPRVQSRFFLQGRIHRQSPEKQPKPDTYRADMVSRGISNATVLRRMVSNGDIEKIDDHTLIMVQSLEGEPELMAINLVTKDRIPVPAGILELTMGERIGSYRRVEKDGETTSENQDGFQSLDVEWMADSDDSLSLSGIGRYKSALKSTLIESEKVFYDEQSWSVVVKGMSEGGSGEQ